MLDYDFPDRSEHIHASHPQPHNYLMNSASNLTGYSSIYQMRHIYLDPIPIIQHHYNLKKLLNFIDTTM